MENSNTVSVDNRFAIIPHWVILSDVSDSGLRLYAVLMKYANNETGQAWPSRASLAKDLRKSEKTVDRAIKELSDLGALRVTRRRKPGTKEFHSNLYTVITAPPIEVAPNLTLGAPTNVAVTIPTELDPSPFTSEQSSDPMLHVQSSITPTEIKPIDALNDQDRLKARYLIIKIALHVRARGSFWDDIAQEAWKDLMDLIENRLLMGGWDPDMDLMDTWTISGTPSTPYEAGAELNKILHHLSQ